MEFENYKNLKYLGKLETLKSSEIGSSAFGVGCECLDRDMWNQKHAWDNIEDLGVKWARVQTGWAKTEKEKCV